MSKEELINKIKKIVSSYFNKQENVVNLDKVDSLSKFPVMDKFPSLKDTILKLFTSQYDLFIKEIQWVAPRPTTLRIVLMNDQFFFLIYGKRDWYAKIRGKKYNLLNISEEERAVNQISELLSYGAFDEETIPVEGEDSGGESGGTPEPEPEETQ